MAASMSSRRTPTRPSVRGVAVRECAGSAARRRAGASGGRAAARAGAPGMGPGGPGDGPGGGGALLDPLIGLNDTTKPLRLKLLSVPSLRARYPGRRPGSRHHVARLGLARAARGPVPGPDCRRRQGRYPEARLVRRLRDRPRRSRPSSSSADGSCSPTSLRPNWARPSARAARRAAWGPSPPSQRLNLPPPVSPRTSPAASKSRLSDVLKRLLAQASGFGRPGRAALWSLSRRFARVSRVFCNAVRECVKKATLARWPENCFECGR